MPEEEAFTFVDKRRTQADAVPEVAVAASDVPANPEEEFGEEDFGTETASDDGPMPDVYSMIGYCVSLLSSEAWHKLGLLADPNTGQAQPDLVQAKVAIDAVSGLAVHLEAAPGDSVSDSMRKELRTLLNDLRLNYVAQQNKPA